MEIERTTTCGCSARLLLVKRCPDSIPDTVLDHARLPPGGACRLNIVFKAVADHQRFVWRDAERGKSFCEQREYPR